MCQPRGVVAKHCQLQARSKMQIFEFTASTGTADTWTSALYLQIQIPQNGERVHFEDRMKHKCALEGMSERSGGHRAHFSRSHSALRLLSRRVCKAVNISFPFSSILMYQQVLRPHTMFPALHLHCSTLEPHI